MNITIASGKGGTGKTTFATSLALSLARAGNKSYQPIFLDCDVEAPNAHIFLQPAYETCQDVAILIPHINTQRCNQCGICVDACQFHAIAVVGTQTMLFPELCHGCGSCTLLCPQNAITEYPFTIGVCEGGKTTDGILFGRGVLNIGQPMTVPIVHQLKQWMMPTSPQSEHMIVMDAPPGTSCPVVETMRGSDVVLLVTEPTPFGLHDLRLAVQVTRELGIPVGVIVNRDRDGYDEVDAYCKTAGVPILMRIPFDRALAEGIARGIPLIDIRPSFIPALRDLYTQVVQLGTVHTHQSVNTQEDSL